jgi:hypothetical protein
MEERSHILFKGMVIGMIIEMCNWLINLSSIYDLL